MLLTKRWLDHHRVEIKGLSDERRAVYDDIVAMSPDPQRIDILRPKVRTEDTEHEDGSPVPTVTRHLMADECGNFPIASLNDWETRVLEAEMGRPDALAWYRNPGRASDDSLAIAYRDGRDNWRRMCPDFMFFAGSESDVRVSIVDPHGYHLGDALPKLRGLADFTEAHGEAFHQHIEFSVARMKDGTLRVLDMTKEDVRSAVRSARDAEQLYVSSVGAVFYGGASS